MYKKLSSCLDLPLISIKIYLDLMLFRICNGEIKKKKIILNIPAKIRQNKTGMRPYTKKKVHIEPHQQ